MHGKLLSYIEQQSCTLAHGPLGRPHAACAAARCLLPPGLTPAQGGRLHTADHAVVGSEDHAACQLAPAQDCCDLRESHADLVLLHGGAMVQQAWGHTAAAQHGAAWPTACEPWEEVHNLPILCCIYLYFKLLNS